MYLKYFLSFYNMTLFSNYNKDFVKMYFFSKKIDLMNSDLDVPSFGKKRENLF